MLIVIATLMILLAVSAAGVCLYWMSPRGWLSRHTARRVIVHTNEGQSLEGLLTKNAPDGLVLTAAIILDSSAEPVQLGGTIWIPRDKLAFLQIKHDVKVSD